jgi:TDG/mug DNA glycosylase family protein
MSHEHRVHGTLMARFTRAELESYRGASIPDLVGPGLKLLFVGINPGLWTAATQTPFAHPQNKFYPALVAAGILTDLPDFSNGLTDDDRATLVSRGLGITNLVTRATGMAKELTTDELRAGADRLRANVASWRPRVVAVLGVGAYQKAFSRSKARAGLQAESLEGAELWVLTNPSPANPTPVAALARAYSAPARSAGVL